VAINIQFQNISQANSEILKAFNSTNSAKALEAYQPLDSKERKLEKLRALQILKQSSNSATLADISLSTTTLSIALQNAEGATLQAMLNLLSAKMVEQNKYTYYDEEDRKKLREKVQQKLDQQKEKNQENQNQDSKNTPEQEDSAVEKFVQAVQTYFEDIYNDILDNYKNILSALSFQNLKKAFSESVRTIARLAYETPIEAFREFVIEPIEDFRDQLKSKLDEVARQGLQKSKSKRAFSAGEIKAMLQKSLTTSKTLKESDETKLLNAISTMDTALKMQKSITQARKKFGSKTELKLALHQ
jgi:hypothetical protein